MKRTISLTAAKNNDVISFENRIEETTRQGLVKPVSHTVELKENDFLSALSTTESLGLLPYGVRWCSADQRSLIIEEAPGYKTINFRNGPKDAYTVQVKQITVPLPWIYYGISPGPNSMPYVSHIFGTFKQIDLSLEYMYALPLPNIFNTGAVCTHIITDEREELSYSAIVNLAIAEFWNSVFNLDVNHYQKNLTYIHLCDLAGISKDKLAPFTFWSSMTPDTLQNLPWMKLMSFQQMTDAVLKNNDYYSFGVSPANRLMSQLLVASMTNS